MEKNQSLNSKQLKTTLSAISASRVDGLLQSFLLGIVFQKFSLNGKNIDQLVQTFEQFASLAKESAREDILNELYEDILKGNIHNLIPHIEKLTDRLFQVEELPPQINEFSQMSADELHQFKTDSMIKEEQSVMLAMQLEIEEEESKQNKQNQNQKEKQEWNCEICLEEMEGTQFTPLSCEHVFHSNCVQQYLKQKIADRQFPLKCPNLACKRELNQADLREILDKSDFQKCEEFQLNQFIDLHSEDMSWCPSAGCKYAFVLEKNQEQLICPLCRKRYCLTCRVDFHQGQSCKEYQISNTFSEGDRIFQKFIAGSKFKQCLKCKMWVEKNQGCDHMTCRCGCQFCYRCGGPYPNCSCRR